MMTFGKILNNVRNCSANQHIQQAIKRMNTTKRLIPPLHSEQPSEDFRLFRFMENFRKGVELFNRAQIKKNSTMSTVKNFEQSCCEKVMESNQEKELKTLIKQKQCSSRNLSTAPKKERKERAYMEIKKTEQKKQYEKPQLKELIIEKLEFVKEGRNELCSLPQKKPWIQDCKKSIRIKRVYGRNDIKGVVFREKRRNMKRSVTLQD